MAQQSEIFDKPWLVLCEGQADKSLLDFLIRELDIHRSQIAVKFPGREGEHSGGKSKFAAWISRTHNASIDFRRNVTHISIIADNDEDPATSFAELTKDLANKGLPSPRTENTFAKKPSFPAILVHMLPRGARGTIETLWLPAAYRASGLQGALDTYLNATPAKGWSKAKQEKMRSQVLVASLCEEAPQSSFANHWQKMACVAASDAEFANLVSFLRSLDTKLI